MIRLICLLFIGVLFFSCDDDDVVSTSCSTPATVRDLSGLDGCGFVFELEDGTRLEPVFAIGYCGTPPLPKEVTEHPLYNFQFVDGKKVFIDYELVERPSICMVGQTVEIICVSEAAGQSNL